MWLSDTQFAQALSLTPLISIDMLFEDSIGRVLLGQRRNRPAKGFWFVPGGRIRKNENIEDAFLRLSGDELGRIISIAEARFSGVYQHFYSETVFNDGGDTHYVALAFKFDKHLGTDQGIPDLQHEKYRWFSKD